MSLGAFDDALRRVLLHEGGYTNNAADPGGPTNFGITIGDYRKYIKTDATADDVKSMDLNDAKKIYRQRYWQVLRCDDLPAGVDYVVFDYGVNSGVARAGRVLRKQLGLPSSSWIVNDAVVAAASADNPDRLIAAICDERIAFLQSLKTSAVFGKGWSRRVAEVRSAASAMASASAGKGKPTSKAAGKFVATGAVVVAGATLTQGSAGGTAAALLVTAAAILLWLPVRGLRGVCYETVRRSDVFRLE